MKVVVIGGAGFIGPKRVAVLPQSDQQVLAASPDRGVNIVAGDGLPAALFAEGRGRPA